MTRYALICVGILFMGFFSIAFIASYVCAQTSNTTTATTNYWTKGSNSVIPKMESAYTSVGDKIYIIAGYGETGKRNKNSVEVYDTKTDSWSTAAPVPANLNHASAATLNGKIYLVGGSLMIRFRQTNSSYTTPQPINGRKAHPCPPLEPH